MFAFFFLWTLIISDPVYERPAMCHQSIETPTPQVPGKGGRLSGFVPDFFCKIPGVFKEFSITRN